MLEREKAPVRALCRAGPWGPRFPVVACLSGRDSRTGRVRLLLVDPSRASGLPGDAKKAPPRALCREGPWVRPLSHVFSVCNKNNA